jgi:hypothetical protein
MFEQAIRNKVRFDSPVGFLCLEDLWDLPLQSRANRPNLDDIARELHLSLKNDDHVSFVDDDAKSDPIAQLKFDIVKHVIAVKKAEAAAERAKSDNAAKKQKILAILADKQDDSLKQKSIEELQELAKSL